MRFIPSESWVYLGHSVSVLKQFKLSGIRISVRRIHCPSFPLMIFSLSDVQRGPSSLKMLWTRQEQVRYVKVSSRTSLRFAVCLLLFHLDQMLHHHLMSRSTADYQ